MAPGKPTRCKLDADTVFFCTNQNESQARCEWSESVRRRLCVLRTKPRTTKRNIHSNVAVGPSQSSGARPSHPQSKDASHKCHVGAVTNAVARCTLRHVPLDAVLCVRARGADTVRRRPLVAPLEDAPPRDGAPTHCARKNPRKKRSGVRRSHVPCLFRARSSSVARLPPATFLSPRARCSLGVSSRCYGPNHNMYYNRRRFTCGRLSSSACGRYLSLR